MSSSIPAVVFDCNIFLQAVLNPSGAAGGCHHLVDRGQVELFVSPQILAEVAEVLSRPAIRRLTPALTLSGIEAFLQDISAKAITLVNVPEEFRFERDPKDQAYVNLAIIASAKYLVTRDNDLLDLMRAETNEAEAFRRAYPMLTILDPVAFLRKMRE
jgi:uncharacterized protein